jgi:hypothetical protein
MQRIFESAEFRNAHNLQQLLQFLVVQAYGPDPESLKEYTIGVEAFGRPQDFDPKTDPIVRVQTHRLRQKLKEYYDTDGRHDPILIEIPKGHYLPTFAALAVPNGSSGSHAAAHAPDADAAGAPSANGSDTHGFQAPPARRRFAWPLYRRIALASAVVLAVFAAGFWFGIRQSPSAAARNTASASSELSFNPSTDPVKAFWADLLGSDSTPVIAYPDAVFLLDDSNDLFRFRHGASDFRGAPVDPHLAQEFASNPSLIAKAGKLYYENAYLGAGELNAVGMLANLFGRMGLKPDVEPGKDLTPDDLKQHNVVLLGSSFQSFAVAQLNTMGDFSFRNPDTRLEEWRGVIVNAHPRPGEASVYRTERDPVTQVLETDHALITVEPGVVPGRYIADFGGLDTTGTEGAVLFATSKSGIQELSRALAAQGIHGGNGAPPLFQALLSVRLEKGYEVLGASLITVHPLSSAHKAVPSPAPAAAKESVP